MIRTSLELFLPQQTGNNVTYFDYLFFQLISNSLKEFRISFLGTFLDFPNPSLRNNGRDARHSYILSPVLNAGYTLKKSEMLHFIA